MFRERFPDISGLNYEEKIYSLEDYIYLQSEIIEQIQSEIDALKLKIKNLER